LLQNLYRLKSLGFEYSDLFVTNRQNSQQLPQNLAQLHDVIDQCHLCDLSKSRRQSMHGSGNPDADLMIVDAYVSLAEDEGNRYYTGRSGASLVKMVENVLGMRIEDVFFTHAVKCKPLGSQTPSNSEWKSCKPYLFKQIELIRPKVVMTLGPEAYALLSGDESGFEKVRGHKIDFGSYTLVPIYHPQFLLRNPSLKTETLNDLYTVKSCL
jgi:uracil-DNA glycosylase family 4